MRAVCVYCTRHTGTVYIYYPCREWETLKQPRTQGVGGVAGNGDKTLGAILTSHHKINKQSKSHQYNKQQPKSCLFKVAISNL